ncbi:hypothetical protein [Rhizobium sp. 18055]|jgi:hypothetical protein|uniref:hypothetical protein n=1 Tax=Rhizobium sp. 18055 TaxID=2681403 RepID=UPI00135A6652|nr:hypothetical protein [Rhizobium sp. 18055]
MEITSLRFSPNLSFRKHSDNSQFTNGLNETFDPAASALAAFKVDDIATGQPDFAAISASELRNHARQSLDSGALDQNTYAAISEPLPMHTIDPSGNVLDLSDVTDGTSFNFRDYYKDQLQIAMSIGNPQTVETLKSVVSFLDD